MDVSFGSWISYCTLDLGLPHRWHYSITIPLIILTLLRMKFWRSWGPDCCAKSTALPGSTALCQKCGDLASVQNCIKWIQMNSNDNSARVEWTWQDMTRQDKTWGQSSSILSVVFCCRVTLACTAKGQNLESSLIQQTQESCLVQPAAEYSILQVSGGFRNTWTNFVPAALPCLVKSRQSAAKAWPGKSGWQWNQVQNESQKVVKR